MKKSVLIKSLVIGAAGVAVVGSGFSVWYFNQGVTSASAQAALSVEVTNESVSDIGTLAWGTSPEGKVVLALDQVREDGDFGSTAHGEGQGVKLTDDLENYKKEDTYDGVNGEYVLTYTPYADETNVGDETVTLTGTVTIPATIYTNYIYITAGVDSETPTLDDDGNAVYELTLLHDRSYTEDGAEIDVYKITNDLTFAWREAATGVLGMPEDDEAYDTLVSTCEGQTLKFDFSVSKAE